MRERGEPRGRRALAELVVAGLLLSCGAPRAFARPTLAGDLVNAAFSGPFVGRSSKTDVPLLTWQHDVTTNRPLVVPEGGILARPHPFAGSTAPGFTNAEAVVTTTIGPSDKAVGFTSDVAVGKRIYPFLWVTKSGTLATDPAKTFPDQEEPAFALLPGERFRVSTSAVSWATLGLAYVQGGRRGNLAADVTTPTYSQVQYLGPSGSNTAEVMTIAGRVWAEGGAIGVAHGERIEGRPIKVPLRGQGDVTALSFAFGGPYAPVSVDLSPDSRGNLLLTPVLEAPFRDTGLPKAIHRQIGRRRYIAGASSFFVVAVRGHLDIRKSAPVFTGRVPGELPVAMSLVARGAFTTRRVAGGPIVVRPSARSPFEGAAKPLITYCQFGLGVPDPKSVAARSSTSFRGGHVALEGFSIGSTRYTQLSNLGLVGADVDGVPHDLTLATSESFRRIPDAPWDRGWNSATDGVEGPLSDIFSECGWGSRDGQVVFTQYTDGRVQGVEADAVWDLGSVLVEVRLFAASSSKTRPTLAAIGVRARALALDGELHRVRLRGLVALVGGAIWDGDGRESATPGGDMATHMLVTTSAGNFEARVANWGPEPNSFAPIGRYPGPTSEVVVVNATASIEAEPTPNPAKALGPNVDAYFQSAANEQSALLSYATGLLANLVVVNS